MSRTATDGVFSSGRATTSGTVSRLGFEAMGELYLTAPALENARLCADALHQRHRAERCADLSLGDEIHEHVARLDLRFACRIGALEARRDLASRPLLHPGGPLIQRL